MYNKPKRCSRFTLAQESHQDGKRLNTPCVSQTGCQGFLHLYSQSISPYKALGGF